MRECLSARWVFNLRIRKSITIAYVLWYTNNLSFTSFVCSSMYTTIKQRRKQSSTRFYYSYLFLAVVVCGICFFFAYRFFLRIHNNQSYQMANQNKYYSYLSKTLHGEHSPEEESSTISPSDIESENNRIIESFVQDFKSRSDQQRSEFDLSIKSQNWVDIQKDETGNAIPVVIFSTLENPVWCVH